MKLTKAQKRAIYMADPQLRLRHRIKNQHRLLAMLKAQQKEVLDKNVTKSATLPSLG